MSSNELEHSTNVRVMVREWLKEGGYFGLYNESGECGCGLDDLAPCGCLSETCVAAFRFFCFKCLKSGVCKEWECAYDDEPYAISSPDPDFCQPDYSLDGILDVR